MQSVRSGRLAKFVAIVLLLWAGADLINANLCAIDRPPIGVPDGHATITVASSPDRFGSPVTGDDCFCCSHNVLVATSLFPIPIAGPIQAIRFVPPDHLRLLQARLYHPPQLV